jgi:hypothetical protein
MALFRKKDPGEGKDYEGKSRRIQAWSSFLHSLSRFIWLVVILIVLVVLGKLFLFKGTDKTGNEFKPIKKTVVKKVKWEKINQNIARVMKDVRFQTERVASEKLDQWIDKQMKRVDDDFLEWYFSYWTQQKIGLKSLLYQVLNWVDSDNPSPAERITREVQEEFANRVLRPQIAQMEVERIINETISQYSTKLNEEFRKIPQEYHIKRAEWERYLGDIAIMVENVEANRRTSLSLKAVAGVTAGGMILMLRSIRPIITKISSRISTRMASKAASRMATKTGGQVAARMGGKFAGTLIAMGIIIWDVWDHYQTRKKALPVLRQNIYDYFKEVKQSILNDPEHGIMTIIYDLETRMSQKILREK